jgi:pimeloyl-ACP methyl ester carboxylesterase
MDAAKSVTATFVEYSVDCSSYAAYSSGLDPIVRSSGAASTTVIMMHGKAAMPDDVYLLPFYDELSVAGYDVVAPFMPWRRLDWDGSMCEAMNYIDELAAQEAIKGNAVIIAGHSMGGAHALIYAATSPAAAVKAIVTLAPGHFPHLELPLLTVFDPITAASISSSIAKAEDMVANGFGDQVDTFDTLIPDLNNPPNLLNLLQISATANDYLSYHALYQYPDINDLLPAIELPVLWLAGADDPLTSIYDMPALFSRITSPISTYQAISGDHLGMVSNSAAPIVVWMPLLGL